MRRSLKKAGIDFKQEVKIGKYYADFLITNSNLIIECDGEYWHRSNLSKERDSQKDKFLSVRGYKVIRFTEQQIKETKGDCVHQYIT